MSAVVSHIDTAATEAASAYEDAVARARALAPRLSDRAAAGETARRIAPETLRDLQEAGLFKALRPRRFGGLELDYVALVDIGEALAAGDASVAWVATNLASHDWMLAMFPAETQMEVWEAEPDALIASSFVFPSGTARRAGEGYRLSGDWPYSSGVADSAWTMLGAVVHPSDDVVAPEYRIFLLPKADYAIRDTWDAAGLRGTGSNDVSASDVYVPAARTLAVSEIGGGPTPGAALNPGALYRAPVFALFPFVLSGVALGNAQACLDDFTQSARTRASRYNRAKLADFQSTQIKIAEAGARIDAARAIMRTACLDAMADARAGVRPDVLRKTRYRRDGAFAVKLCTEAVDMLFTASGAGGLAAEGRLQRQFRDAHAVQAHIAFSSDAAGANHGRVALGFPSDNPTL